MIDLKLELQDYRTINLKDIAQNEADISDNIRNSVTLYNKAIESLNSGSEDIAIIELKKAIAMNPRFYEAMNLLGVCYNYVNEKDKAAEIFDRVVKAEYNSVKALKYLNQMNSGEESGPGRAKVKKRTAPAPVREDAPGKDVLPGKTKKIRYADGIKMLLGFLAGALVIAAIFLLSPGGEKAPNVPASTGGAASKADEELTRYKTMYDDLNAKHEQLQKDNDAAVAAVDYYKSVIKLYDAEGLANKKQYEAAAEQMLLLKTVEFKDADKQKFDDLYKSVMPAAAQAAYDEGYTLYNQRKYPDSLKKLEKVETYDSGFERMDAVLYYTGRCDQFLNDSRTAVSLFQKLIDTYPKSNYAKNAKVRLRDLTQTP